MSLERVQKVLARAGVAARRKSEDLIREGRVTINGEVAKLGDKADASADSIKVDGKRVHCQRSHHYLLINKPRGYLTAVTDDAGQQQAVPKRPEDQGQPGKADSDRDPPPNSEAALRDQSDPSLCPVQRIAGEQGEGNVLGLGLVSCHPRRRRARAMPRADRHPDRRSGEQGRGALSCL